jgi:hypothetical protein
VRIHMTNLERAKAVSKRMKQSLEPFEPSIKLSRCQALVARMFGYADWHELNKSHALAQPTLDDEFIPKSQCAERSGTFIARLIECGIDANIARYLVEALHPTSERPAHHHTSESFLNHLSTLLDPFRADSFWLGCEGKMLGTVSYRQGGRMHNFPLRRPDLASSARALFSAEAGHHPAARTEVKGAFPVMFWRTQWNGNDTGYNMPSILMGVAGFRPKAEWPDDVPKDYWGRMVVF